MTISERFWDEKIRLIARAPYILDIGGGFKLQKGLTQYKQLFERSIYCVLDINDVYKPDIVGDVQDMHMIDDESVDAVILKAVLEHVQDPNKAVHEVYRILKPGGTCLVYAPFLYSYHARKGTYNDYYRYTLDGLKWLFRDFSKLEYVPVRGRLETIIYLFPIKFIRKHLSPLTRPFDRLFRTEYQSSGYQLFVVK